MSDFLQRIAERTLGAAPVVQPMIAPIFAPGLTTADSTPTLLEVDEFVESPSPASRQPRRETIRTVHQSPSPVARASEPRVPQPALIYEQRPLAHTNSRTLLPQTDQKSDIGEKSEVPRTVIARGPLPAPLNVPEKPISHEQQSVVSDEDTAISDIIVAGRPSVPTTNAGNRIEDRPASIIIRQQAPLSNAYQPGPSVQSSLDIPTRATQQKYVSSQAPEQFAAAIPSTETGGLPSIVHEQGLTLPVQQEDRNNREQPELYDDASVIRQRDLSITVSEEHRIESSSQQPLLSEGTRQPSIEQGLLVPQPQPGSFQQPPVQTIPTYQGAIPISHVPHQPSGEAIPRGIDQRMVNEREVQQETSTIRVTIGRVDVRAITTPPAPLRPKPTRSSPALSLEQYAQQNRERR